MKAVGITRLREDLAQFVRRAEMLSTPVIIKRNGHEVAAIVSIEDYKTLVAANEATQAQKNEESTALSA